MSTVTGKWALAFSLLIASLGSAFAQMYEVYNPQLELIQKINNDHIFLLSESIRVSDKDQHLKLLNPNYEPFLELEGSSIYQYLSPWILVEQDGKLGAYHEYGELIMKPDYDHIDTRYNELLGKKGNTFYHYDIGSKTLQALGSFQEAHIAKNGQIIAKTPAGYQLPLSDSPQQVYQHLESVSNGTILSHGSSGYGLINREGEYILAPVLDTLQHLEDEFFFGYNENQYMLIKATEDDAKIEYSSYHKIIVKNDVILEYIHGRLRRIMKNDGILLDIMGMADVVRIDADHYNVYFKNGKVGLLDSKGIWQVVPADSITAIQPGNEERFGALQDRHYGYVNRAGKWIIPHQYEGTKKFSEGLAAVKDHGAWGYIDSHGSMIIPAQYDDASEFHNGLAIVKKDGNANLIDRSGKEILKEYYQHIALSDDHYYITENNGSFGMIDPTGKEIVTPTFQSVRREGYDKIIVQKNGRFGIINETGEALLPVYYQDIIIDNSNQKILAEDIYKPIITEDDSKKKRKKKD
ncbi:WG repeat-containing protein [Echinicola strongylocentroti]|uniref:WG repeat-containing protein n=1 Tax=Echinicola strongylocentroti TaxID=1795355 RepID=A0A2Z4IG92_9BACT|nr:WG repeat-containing protein [Echinicola strongylocentroti]AWW29925.1 WG repeat-containing protein [Echinicola strongylocentroti]